MPIMDGLEATRKLRKLGNEQGTVPIVALTANAQQKERDFCESAGMNGFLTKPLHKKVLLEELSRYAAKCCSR